jgi:hypothetical protein
MSVFDDRGLALIEMRVRWATNRRSPVPTDYGLGDLFASDRVPPPNPLVNIWTCASCDKHYCGQPLVHPRCPDCNAPLVHTDIWDLRIDAFRPLTRGRWRLS